MSALPAAARPSRRARTRAAPRWMVPLALLPIGAALVGAVAGGLLRAGVPAGDGAVIGSAALGHAALMIGAFLGTVIAVERAAALRQRLAWLGPAVSAAAGIVWLGGAETIAAALLLAASLLFVGANIVVMRRQRAAHTALLLAAAVAWTVGNFGLVAGFGADAIAAWWFTFLVMTIAAERLEMARLMRHDARAQRWLIGLLVALAGGAALQGAAPVGGVLYGGALLALAGWLGRYDIARRTVRSEGLPRYMAACLLSGYAWLAVAGIAWAATALGWAARDAALHALGLGFVFAMMMGHAPVILPAVARIKVQYGAVFYAPLALLQVSLLVRLGGGAIDAGWRAAGAVLNAAAIALFALVIAGGAIVWRRRERVAALQPGRQR
ncbi:MAG TPA: hypothetical protein VLU41_12135 [Ideonella sp.]|nr:hypothetical protein [Ideonella sp.]